MVAARGLVIGMVVFDELRYFFGQRVNDSTCHCHGVGKALFAHCLTGSMARLLFVVAVEITIAADTAHIVHSGGDGGLDAGVGSSSVECNATPATDADDADTLRVDIVQLGEEVNGSHKVLSVDVGRSGAAGFSAALASIGRVESQCHETTLSHPHGIESAALLLDGTERTAHGNGCQLALCILWRVEVGRQRQPILCLERHLAVVHLFAQREHLVPLLSQTLSHS